VATYNTRFDLKTSPLLFTAAHAVNTVQFKVNGTDPYTAMVYLHVGLLQLWLFMPHRSVWSTGWVVRVNAIASYADALYLQQNILHSSFCFSMVHWKCLTFALIRLQLPQLRETLIVLSGKEQWSPTFKSRSFSESKCKPRSTTQIEKKHYLNLSWCNVNQFKTVL
jgi:hypothetical protein